MSPNIADQAPVLALDTHATLTGLAIYTGTKTLLNTTAFGRDLDANLAGFVEDSLQGWGLNFKDLRGLLAVVGPGGFNGIRIGLAYMRGLALGLDVPIYGITSLEAQVGGGNLPKWTCLPARRRDPDKSWWVQRFDQTQPHAIQELDAQQICAEIDRGFQPPETKNSTQYAEGALAWWQAGRPIHAGAEAAFVRSALR